MSKEMKDFLSQFMNQPAAKTVEIDEPKPIKETKPKAEKKEKPKPEKKTEAKPKAVKASFTVQRTPHGEEGIANAPSIEAFLQTVNDKKYSFNQKKNLQIDDQLFTILNLLKQHENIKSIATFLNAIIEKFIEDNKDDLKKILSKNPLG